MLLSNIKSNNKQSKTFIRILFVLGVFFFKILLEKYYEVFGPAFGYLGFKYIPQDNLLYFAVTLVLLVTSFFLPLNYKKPSNIFLTILYLMSYVPVTVLYVYDSTASTSAYFFYTFFIIGLSLLDKVKFTRLKVKKVGVSPRTFNIILFGMILFILIILIRHYGFSINIKSLDDIYETRANFKLKTGGSRFLSFSFSWLANVLTIFLLVSSIVKKKWHLVIFALLIQYFLFNLGGNKSIFMLPIFISFILFGLIIFKRFAPIFILFSFVFLLAGLYIHDSGLNNHFSPYSSILVRRNFFVPANLYFHYFDYFSFNPHDYFAKSFPFNLFLDSYYTKDIPDIIGEEYIRKGTHANGNFLADLYYNLNWLGFAVGFVFMFIYFKIVDAIASYKNHLIIVPLAIVPVISLMNSGLIVNIISFGLLLIVVLLFLYPKQNNLKKINND